MQIVPHYQARRQRRRRFSPPPAIHPHTHPPTHPPALSARVRQGTVVLVSLVCVLFALVMLCTARRVPAWLDLPAICDALGARKIFGR